MSHRYGVDNEERSAIAKKAQDSYAISRQAMEKIRVTDERSAGLSVEVEDLRAEVAGLQRRLALLERQFEAATEPVAKPRKKVA